MMKKLTILVLAAITLTACSLGQPNSSDTEQSASMTRVAGAVSATQTALAATAVQAPTLTPTPSRLPLDETLLTGDSLNVLLGIWPPEPEQTVSISSNPLCKLSCFQQLWVSTDKRATLQIDLIEYGNRDQVVIELRDIKASQAIIGVREVDLPEYSELPTDSWMQDNGSTGSRYTLHTRKGRVLIIMTIYLPQFDEMQNLLFLSLYGNQQIDVLENSGW